MIALPFVYFFIWFILEFKKRSLDVYTFILFLYTIISFFSILLDFNNAYTPDSCPKMPSLGVIAPLVYITLLTICIHPFSYFNSNAIQKLTGRISEKKFNIVIYAYFAMFLIVLLVSATRLQEILTSNAFAEMRYELYTGEAISFYDHLSGIPRYICAMCTILGPSSFLMILFFFIGLIHFHKGLFFSIITLCGSMTMLLIAINIVDRSYFAYWTLTFILCYITFRHRLSKQSKRYFYILALVLVSIFVIYMIAVTISRFGERDGGAISGIYLYLGQSYINFCNFFNYMIFDVPHKPEIVLMPNFNKYILNGPGYFEFAEQLSNKYHHGVAVFSTFIGFIMSISGLWVTIIYCFIFSTITRFVIRRPKKNIISMNRLILFWIVVLNPALGLFTYFYFQTTVVLAIMIWWIIGQFISRRFTSSKI